MAGVGGGRSCPLAQTPVTKLQNKMESMLFEDTIVDAGVDDEAFEVWQTHVVAGGRGPNKQVVEDHVASRHAQRRTWCDAWMRARGIAGRHEKRELGRKDEDPLVATGYGHLKLEGTDDDADDEVAQNISSLLSTM